MIEHIEKYCVELLSSPEIERFSYHNLDHTLEVVQNVKYITAAMDINPRDTELLVIAAWFHDTGFIQKYKGHEEVSKQIAKNFLEDLNVDQTTIEEICDCIEATKMPPSPATVLAEILCDADIFHISNLHFFYKKILLRKEWEVFCDMSVTDKEWHLLNIDFLEKCSFRSTYGKNFLEIGKQENVERVKKILAYYE
jgi:predicted metal-dependent HD superfamily phosphohydrolase